MLPMLLLPVARADTLSLRHVDADACGALQGVVDVRPTFFGRTLEVRAGDRTVAVDVPAGATDAPFALEVPRAERVEVVASWWFLESDPVTVDVPALALALSMDAPGEVWSGEPFEVTVRLVSRCPTLPLPLRLSTGDGTVLALEEVLPGDAVRSVTLGRPGEVLLRADVRDPLGAVAEADRGIHVGPACVDADGDGHRACRHEDCDDGDALVHPGQKEVVGNRKDDDCDGVNGKDGDRDGHESADVGGDDCDDGRAWVHPGASAWPDPDGDGAVAQKAALDLDCDGETDEPGRFDCDERNPTIPRDEDPVPTQVDEDCDGIVDEGTVAYDDDGDGLAELAGDCNDADTSVRPGRAETPDCRDEDCDGAIDEDTVRRHQDDRYEPNDTASAELPGATWVPGFFGGHWRGSRTSFRAVTRDGGDVERYRIHAHDGFMDNFNVSVHVARLGDARSYEVTIVSPGGGVTSRTVTTGDTWISYGGSAGFDDSGDYEITITPTGGELDWCPVELTVSSG